MTRDDAQAFSTLLAGLAETFDVTLSATRTELYFRALEDVPLSGIQAAAGRALRECRFFPKPVELRELAGDDLRETADFAWLALLESFQDGYYGVRLPDDPIVQALVRVFWGEADRAREWWRLCHEAALESRRKEFIGRYRDYALKPLEALPRLPGGRGILAMLEAMHARAADPRGGHADPQALSVPPVSLDVGLRSSRRADAVPGATQASGAAEHQRDSAEAAPRRAPDRGRAAGGDGG